MRQPEPDKAARAARRVFDNSAALARRSLYLEASSPESQLGVPDLIYDGEGRNHQSIYCERPGARAASYLSTGRPAAAPVPPTTNSADNNSPAPDRAAPPKSSAPPPTSSADGFLLAAELARVPVATLLLYYARCEQDPQRLGGLRKAEVVAAVASAMITAGVKIQDLEQ